MKKIFIYIGQGVEKLKFQCGGGEVGLKDGEVIYSVDATHRDIIESRLHPQKVAEKVLKEIEYCKKHFDLHISTHSDVAINVIGQLIHSGKMDCSIPTIYVLSEDNKEVLFESKYDEKGVLLNWPYGFMDWDVKI